MTDTLADDIRRLGRLLKKAETEMTQFKHDYYIALRAKDVIASERDELRRLLEEAHDVIDTVASWAKRDKP